MSPEERAAYERSVYEREQRAIEEEHLRDITRWRTSRQARRLLVIKSRRRKAS